MKPGPKQTRRGRAAGRRRARPCLPKYRRPTEIPRPSARLCGQTASTPRVLDGPINGRNFATHIKQMLAPTLSSGDIAIIDDLGSHKSRAVRNAIRATGTKLPFLPPYSPDLNPIEQVFAKLKTRLRKAAERPVEATWKRIGTLLTEFKPGECANYLRNSGYASH